MFRLIIWFIAKFHRTPVSTARPGYSVPRPGYSIPAHLWEKHKGICYGKYNDIW